MACNCDHGNRGLKFPLFGPQPLGDTSRWPEFFIPDPTAPGFGHYHCPSCRDGLVEARAKAGLPKLENGLKIAPWRKVLNAVESFFDFLFDGIRSHPTAGGSR